MNYLLNYTARIAVTLLGASLPCATALAQEAMRPDLQGVWSNASLTSLTRMNGVESLVVSAEEARCLVDQRVVQIGPEIADDGRSGLAGQVLPEVEQDAADEKDQDQQGRHLGHRAFTQPRRSFLDRQPVDEALEKVVVDVGLHGLGGDLRSREKHLVDQRFEGCDHHRHHGARNGQHDGRGRHLGQIWAHVSQNSPQLVHEGDGNTLENEK